MSRHHEDPADHPSVRAFDARAAAAVAAVSQAAVAAVLANFPEAHELGLRDDPGHFNPHRKAPPKDPKKRAQYLREQIERWLKSVDVDVERYNELRTKGLAALSSCDINMSGPLNAYRTALDLKCAHITHGLTMVHNLRMELADTLQKLGELPQLALF